MAHHNGVFPELTIEVPSAQVSGTAVASTLATTVQNALREVLAWRPKPDDPKGFLTAIDQAFTLYDVEGRTTWKWTPRSYTVQAEMGAVTGAQASIYARAKAALDQSIPFIKGLYPLRADADREDAEAIRALVQSQLTELVNELGVVGGPRLPRVEGLFDALLGVGFGGSDPEQVEGLLGSMRAKFGLERLRVNTIEEEQNLTNFLIVTDHTLALRRSWNAVKKFFDRTGTDVFLGTQLVLLSRLLGVVADSVRELCFLLDSVRLGANERQTVMLDSGLTIAELLSWVERFTTEEGPGIIREAGKDGVVALQATLAKLVELVQRAWWQAKGQGTNPQAGFHSERVQVGLEELTLHLREALKFAAQIRRQPRPELKVIEPNTAVVGETVLATLYGEHFLPGAEVRLVWPNSDLFIASEKVLVVNSTMIRADFVIPEDIHDVVGVETAVSHWSVVVEHPDGSMDWLTKAFTIEEEAEVEAPPPLEVAAVTFYTLRGERVTKGADDVLEGREVASFQIAFTEALDFNSVRSNVLVSFIGDGGAIPLVPGNVLQIGDKVMGFQVNWSLVLPTLSRTRRKLMEVWVPMLFALGRYEVRLVGGEDGLQGIAGGYLKDHYRFDFVIGDEEEE